MKITITPEMLCDLLNGKFTLDACEAICEIFDECAPDDAPMIGDIAISFEEMSYEDLIETYGENAEDDYIVRTLDNGNYLVAI